MAHAAEVDEQGQERLLITPRSVRLARFATAGVRFLNGFLLLIVAFAFRTEDAGILDFSAFLAAGGRIPDESTCRSCHRRSENFDYAEYWPKIAHGKPQPAGADEGH